MRRTGSEQTGQWLDSYRWLAGVLRGESSAAAARRSPSTGTPATRWRSSTRTSPARSPPPSSAIRTAWRGTPRRRCRCCRPSMGVYPTAAGPPAARAGPGRAGPRRPVRRARRAAVRAGRGDRGGWPPAPRTRRTTSCTCCGCSRPSGPGRSATSAPPSLAFDAARREVAGRQRPWHRALITERAARFYLAHGLDHAGYDLLAQARESTSPGARPRRSTSSTGPTPPCDRRVDATAGRPRPTG